MDFNILEYFSSFWGGFKIFKIHSEIHGDYEFHHVTKRSLI